MILTDGDNADTRAMDGSMDHQRENEAGAIMAFLARLRALDNDTWAELYDRHHPQIFRYAYARTGSRDTADEVAAQVFSEAISSIHRYRDRGRPILAWLYTIARNTVSKHVRARRKESPDQFDEPSADPIEERLESMVLADALQRLTDDQREVVALRFFAGYSTQEIAAAMGKREGAVYSLEVRAIGALRRTLGIDSRKFPAGADKKAGSPGIDRVR